MKKKGVNILAILAVVLVLVIIGVVLAFVLKEPVANKGNGMGGVDLSFDVLHLENIEDFRAFAETGDYECHIGDDLTGGSVYRVPLLGEEAIVTYYFDRQGNTTDFQAFYFLNADVADEENMEITVMTTEELAVAARDAVERFCMMFGCDFVPDIYLANVDGTFTLLENDSDFQSVKEGTSNLIFSIRAEDGYFWELMISASEDLVSANITKYFDLKESMGYVANISLYEEE